MRSAEGWRTKLFCARSLASMVCSWASMRAKTSGGKSIFLSRVAKALAIKVGVRSALARRSRCAIGLGTDHSPPESSPSSSSNLPTMRGRCESGQLYSSSFNWYSMIWRFSSTTKISFKPLANSRVLCASRGQTTETLWTRIPSRRQVSVSKPRSIKACRVSL